MKLHIETHGLTNPTLMHLEAWLLAIDEHLANDAVFEDMDQLASQLEQWRSEFCHREADLESHWGDQVTVMLYGNEVILISDQRSGEFIKVTEKKDENMVDKQKAKLNPLMKLPKIIQKVLAFALLMFCMAYPAQAESSWPWKKSTGLSVAKAHQKQSVRANKRNRKGLRKASRIVNAELSEKAYGKGALK